MDHALERVPSGIYNCLSYKVACTSVQFAPKSSIYAIYKVAYNKYMSCIAAKGPFGHTQCAIVQLHLHINATQDLFSFYTLWIGQALKIIHVISEDSDWTVWICWLI